MVIAQLESKYAFHSLEDFTPMEIGTESSAMHDGSLSLHGVGHAQNV